MRKSVPFALVEHRVQSAATICTSLQLNSRGSRSPNIHDSQKEDPYNINKVPIQNPKVQRHTILFIRSGQLEKTHSQILSTNHYVGPVETCSLIERASKDTITESERRSSVLKVLAVHEEDSLLNSVLLLKLTKRLIPTIHGMFCRIRGKVRPKKEESVCFRKSSPVNRYNSLGGPTHPQLNGRH